MVDLARTTSEGFPPVAGGLLPSRQTLKRAALALALLSGAAAVGAITATTTGRSAGSSQSTDDAYVKADYTTIAPKVSGYIADVLVEDNQHVDGRPGPGADRRPRLPRPRSTRRSADVETAEAAIRNLDAQIALQQSVIEQAQADDRRHRGVAELRREPTTPAIADLMKTGYGTVQRAQQAEATLQAEDGAAAARPRRAGRRAEARSTC